MGVLGMFRAGAASSHGAWILCPSWPQRSVARSQLRRGMYSVSTSPLSTRCACPSGCCFVLVLCATVFSAASARSLP